MLIVVVEDDLLLADTLATRLGQGGFTTEIVGDGATALRRFERRDLDAAVIDMGLPDMDGVAVIEGARRCGMWAPILVVTARAAVDDRVRALEAGADDYVVKPFDGAEVVARLRALTRRAQAPRWAPLRCGEIVVGTDLERATLGGRPLQLSPSEHALLQFLLRNRGQVVARERILKEVFGYEFDPGTNLVAVHLTHLRSKIAGGGVVIETVRGTGLRLTASGDETPPEA
jgi:DNA-binding response OmpR family regulator